MPSSKEKSKFPMDIPSLVTVNDEPPVRVNVEATSPQYLAKYSSAQASFENMGSSTLGWVDDVGILLLLLALEEAGCGLGAGIYGWPLAQ
jgi:hypothetical protein